jgi:methionyl-tRNA formyltransferase
MSEKSSLSVIFFGTPDFAVASLEALVDHGLKVLAVVTAPDKPAGRGRKLHTSAVKDYALSRKLPVLQPEKLKNKEFLAQLAALKADLQVVVAFRMLPEAVWDMPAMGTLNVHASLLPQYRGAAPINWVLINGEKETGVTIFKLRHEIDTGDILLQQKIAIQPEDNAGSLYGKLMAAGAGLLIQTIQGLEAGTITPQRQVLNGPVNLAPKIFKETCRIHWGQPAVQVLNLIRGLSPYPAAFTFLNNKQLKIFSAVLYPGKPKIAAGGFETDGKTYLRFAAEDAWLDCETVQYEGKKKMPVADFLRGIRLEG